MEVKLDFESIKNNLNILYINNLIKTCEKNNIDKEVLNEALEKLIIPVEEIKKVPSLSTLSPSETNTEYLFQKQWNKLNLVHKKIKIKEVPIKYSGRNYNEGKKIRLIDGIKAIITLFKYRFF
jgi:hypothetical protein